MAKYLNSHGGAVQFIKTEVTTEPEKLMDQAPVADVMTSMVEAGNIGTQIEAAYRALSLRIPKYSDIVAPKPLTLDELRGTPSQRGLLKDDEALVLWLTAPGPQHGLVFAMSKRRTGFAEIPLSGDSIDSLVRSIRKEIDPCSYGSLVQRNCDNQGPHFTRANSWALGKALLREPSIQSVIDDPAVTTLLIASTGSLTSLPPALLLTSPPNPDGFDDRGATLPQEHWLIRDKAIAVLPSVSALRTLRSVDPELQRASRAQKLYVLANPDFAGGRPIPATCSGGASPPPSIALINSCNGFCKEQLARLCPLPETREEADRLDRLFPGGTKRLDVNATEAQLAKDAPLISEASIIDFSTHGLVSGDFGLGEPGLALAMPRPGDTQTDGVLTASEAAGMRLNADWIILSACNTASPDSSVAQGLSGLVRSFFYAGGHTVIASHWRVYSDTSTSLLVEMLRQQGLGLSKALALRQAMLQVLDNKAQKTDRDSFPRAWAPFVLYGDGS